MRSLLARLGYRSLNEIVGRADMLKPRAGVALAKTRALDVSTLINLPDGREDRSWLNHEAVHSNGPVLDDEILADGDVQTAIQTQGTVSKNLFGGNDRPHHLALGWLGCLPKNTGNSGFEGQLNLTFEGSAGQSFGAFNLPGMTLNPGGGSQRTMWARACTVGELVVKPPVGITYDPAENVILGNTCLYGSTGGTLYAQGIAGRTVCRAELERAGR